MGEEEGEATKIIIKPDTVTAVGKRGRDGDFFKTSPTVLFANPLINFFHYHYN